MQDRPTTYGGQDTVLFSSPFEKECGFLGVNVKQAQKQNMEWSVSRNGLEQARLRGKFQVAW